MGWQKIWLYIFFSATMGGGRDTKSFIIKFFLHCLRKTTTMLKISIIFPQLSSMMCGVGGVYGNFFWCANIDKHFQIFPKKLLRSMLSQCVFVCVIYDNCIMCGAAVNGNMIVRFNFTLSAAERERCEWEAFNMISVKFIFMASR
jgi:hypothetical protein